LRTKVGEAIFTVTHPRSGQTWTINPKDYLESHQVMKVATKPDLLLLFGHHLAEEKRREGYEGVEVRARAMVSLNGRPPQLLIDPNVDLTKEQVSLLPTRWIVPLTTPLASGGTQSTQSFDE
jgi:vitamin K-dependent gamma-carboxylase